MDLDQIRLRLSTPERKCRQRQELCRQCGEAGHVAKDCRAPPLKQKLLLLNQYGYVLGEDQEELKNDEGASAPKKTLALPSP